MEEKKTHVFIRGWDESLTSRWMSFSSNHCRRKNNESLLISRQVIGFRNPAPCYADKSCGKSAIACVSRWSISVNTGQELVFCSEILMRKVIKIARGCFSQLWDFTLWFFFLILRMDFFTQMHLRVLLTANYNNISLRISFCTAVRASTSIPIVLLGVSLYTFYTYFLSATFFVHFSRMITSTAKQKSLIIALKTFAQWNIVITVCSEFKKNTTSEKKTYTKMFKWN